MKKIILASNNIHKVQEFKKMLPQYKILALNDIGYYEDIVEDGETFLDNAKIKAKAVFDYLKDKEYDSQTLIVADDSGLCINALNGEPGVHSARYAGDHTVEANRNKVLKKLENVTDRSAYFVTVLAIMNMEGQCNFVEGKTYGEITKDVRGYAGFAYDPIFYSRELGKTFGEASAEEKNSVSHRSRAIEELKKLL